MKKNFLIIIANYYRDISIGLLSSAKRFIPKNSKFKVIEVPGVFEIPVTISKNIKKYDGFIAIGCIIKGETANFDLISKAITDGIMHLSIESKKPIGNSLLTVFNKSQALDRLDKGKEAVTAVLEVLKIK